MKKILLCVVFLPLVLNAQDYSGRVGINTKEPQATLDISKKELNTLPSGHTQGVLFPEFSTTERSTFTNPKKGTVIYNADKKCLEMYLGLDSDVHQWACLPDVGSSKAQSVAVTPQGFEGSYVGGIPLIATNKVKFKLENNSFSSVNSSFADAVNIQNGNASISITSCSWTLLPSGTGGNCFGSNTVNLASGQAALLTYTMSGTPETGTLTANFSKLGAQADQQTQVGQVGLGSATITSPKTEYVVSLTYNGTTPKTEVQGKINNTTDKLIVKIPYTNGSGSYNAVTSQTITTALGEGNDTNTLTLTIPAGNFGVNGNLEATITVGGGDGEYLVKMLPPGQEYEIATIPYTLNGQQYSVVLKGTGGIPDRCFGKTTFDCVGYGSTTEKEHQFIYLPIQGPDGKTWLNNNLGAEYARVGSQWFNPTRQAGALDYTKTTTAEPLSTPTAEQIKKDWRAYGSLFQWQRNPDGNELITWTNATSGTPKYSGSGSVSSSWTNAGTNKFIPYSGSPYSWVNSSLNTSGPHNLWQVNGSNNPCPSGYHVPTHAEQKALHNAILGYDAGTSSTGSNKMWNEQVLRLPASSFRNINATLSLQSSNGWLWSSEQYDSNYTWHLWFNSGDSNAGSYNPSANGF
ncbi:fibrobacter succinogenes major paralogous domain-containing protein, partial [Riemerella anatipestifer]|uniref:fibrobacter succinogenes major paralogous domain-containing protein n=1 Tax=Riemerella anatipestifer TaxID=34085 RepID=UPI0021D5A267